MIYADYNGSSPILPAVREYLKNRLDSELFANPNAIHSIGQKIYQGIEKCREIISESLGCYPDQVIFNSGSSEGISHIFHSLLSKIESSKKIIITSPLEHAVVSNALSYYEENQHFIIKYSEIDQDGVVCLDSIVSIIDEFKNQVAMVTIMAANNETGVIQPYEEIARICSKNKIHFFSDTTQLIGKEHFNFSESALDYAVCSGHKLGAITGTGFILAKEPRKLKPLVFGSFQETGLRGGTQNYLGIETLAVAMNYFKSHKDKLLELRSAKLEFETEIKNAFPQVFIIGENVQRLSGTTLIGYPGVHGQAVQIELESHDIFVTTSSACTDNQPETSRVLKAMNVDDSLGRGVIRISLSFLDGKKEYLAISKALKGAYGKLSKIQSY